ncbi:MAG: STAS domain-containing protein [Chryseobacterium sp.]
MSFLNSIVNEKKITISFKDEKIYDDSIVIRIGEELLSLVETNNYSEYKIDFLNVKYFSSSMLGKLITLNKKIKEKKAKLILCNINPDIMEIFHITRLDKFFQFES